MDTPTGIYLRATIADNTLKPAWVNIRSTVISSANERNQTISDMEHKERIALTRSVDSNQRIPINQWSLLSRQQGFAPLSDSKTTTIYSTATQDHHSSVWIKVELAE